MRFEKLLMETNKNILVDTLEQTCKYLVNENAINNVKYSLEKDFSSVYDYEKLDLPTDIPSFQYISYLYEVITTDYQCRQRLMIDTMGFIIFTKNGLPLLGVKNKSSLNNECLIIDTGVLTKELAVSSYKANKSKLKWYKTYYNSTLVLICTASLVSITYLLFKKRV